MKAFGGPSIPGAAYVLREAVRRGYSAGDRSWCNLGQGQPEVGLIASAPAPGQMLGLAEEDHPYGPVSGLAALREAIAGYYNRLYRADYESKYTADNVAVCGGGRPALARLFATLGAVRLGYRTPDYMSFEDLLARHRHRLELLPIPTGADGGFALSAPRLRAAIEQHSLDAVLFSNPCNPTGQVVRGDALRDCVSLAAEGDCAVLIDEFYSQYVYDSAGGPGEEPVSAARHVRHVDRDPVVLVDGLTKNFRRPGWRLGWVVGPAQVIEQVGLAGTALDGGPSTLIQRAALQMLAPQHADAESAAIRNVFARKRQIMLEGLRRMGVTIPAEPQGTFYVWGDVSGLPEHLADGDSFFAAALEYRVVVVPGRFFDLNPCGRPPAGASHRWVRFSFGPTLDCVQEGLRRLALMVESG